MAKFIASVAKLSPATYNSDKVGDTRFRNSSSALLDYSSVTLDVGIGSGKDAVRYGAVCHFDTGSIPLGAQVDDARFALQASSTQSTSMTADIAVLALTTRLDSVERQFHDARLIYLPDSSSSVSSTSSLWDLGSTSGGSTPAIAIHENQQDGVNAVSQAWIANTSTSPLRWHWIRVRRLYTSSDCRLRARVFSAKGSAGSYYKGALLLDGELTDIYEWPFSLAFTSRYLAPSRTDWYPTEGEVYITEIELIPGATPAGNIQINWNNSYDGSVQNTTVYAAEGAKIQGFGGSWSAPQWESGAAIKNADHAGTIDTVSLPSMTAGNNYSFGSSGYSGATQLTNFKGNLQTALDNRTSTSQWIGLRMDSWDSAGGEIRIFHGIAADQTTDTIDGFKGWVLEIDYTLPHRSVSLDGSASSVVELVGSGTSAVPLVGTATSIAALTGAGTSTYSTLSGSGVSRKELNA